MVCLCSELKYKHTIYISRHFIIVIHPPRDLLILYWMLLSNKKTFKTSPRDKRKYLIYALLCFLAGTLIYPVFRGDTVFLRELGTLTFKVIYIGDSLWSNFILYNLSDALWVLSLMIYISAQSSRSIRLLGLIIPITMESMQALKIIPGTFDLIDLTI